MPAAKKRVTQIAARRKEKKKYKKRLTPISLHPMDFDEAMKKILAAAKKPKT